MAATFLITPESIVQGALNWDDALQRRIVKQRSCSLCERSQGLRRIKFIQPVATMSTRHIIWASASSNAPQNVPNATLL